MIVQFSRATEKYYEVITMVYIIVPKEDIMDYPELSKGTGGK